MKQLYIVVSPLQFNQSAFSMTLSEVHPVSTSQKRAIPNTRAKLRTRVIYLTLPGFILLKRRFGVPVRKRQFLVLGYPSTTARRAPIVSAASW